MDHAHGHPASLSLRDRRRQHHPSHSRRPLNLPNTPSPLRPQPHNAFPRSLQQRRLQLRNAGFRGPNLSAQRIGAKISRLFNSNVESHPTPPLVPSPENVAPDSKTSSRQSQHRQSAPRGILQEITHSTRDRNSNGKAIAVFVDDPERPLLDCSPAQSVSFYHDAPSVQNSPFAYPQMTTDCADMRLREISGNERSSPSLSSPSLSSPLASSMKGRRKRASDVRKTSFQASEYIEHIEKELQDVKESMHSPQSGKPLQEKLKASKTENKMLKAAITELEESFESRVRDAVDHMTNTEVELRRRIKQLEEESVLKDCAIRDLEFQHEQSCHDQSTLDTLKATVEKLEAEKQSLEDTNRSINKRNEVLTELLAFSPGKSHQKLEFSSPVRDRCTPRPRSIGLPKLPSSPMVKQRSRPQSVMVSPSLSSMGYFSPQSNLAQDQNHPSNSRADVDSRKSREDTHSIDSGVGESCSAQSPTLSSSRRSTVASQVSVSPSSWGLPFPETYGDEHQTARPTQRRKPRSFMSGSTQLKPLLLPTMTGESSHPPQASLVPSPLSPTRRNVSENSIDPTISFLSRADDVVVASPEQCAGWTPEEARALLEGSSAPLLDSFDDIITRHEAFLPPQASSLTLGEDDPASLRKEQHEADSQQSNYDTSFEEDTAEFLDPHLDLDLDHTISSIERQLSPTELAFERAQFSDQVTPTQCLGLEMPPPSTLEAEIDDTSYHEYRLLDQSLMDSAEDLLQHETTVLDRAVASVDNHTLFEAASDSSHARKRRLSESSIESDVPSPTPRARIGKEPDPYPFENRQVITPNTLRKRPVPISIPSHTSGSPLTLSRSPRTPQSPFEILQKRKMGPIPIASVTIQTIYGTLSRYTSYIREFKRDPTALARRVIANAWCSNWKRFGKMSWWVLGLFMGPGGRAEEVGRLQGEARDWDWEIYDGACIAERVCSRVSTTGEGSPEVASESPSKSIPRRVRFDDNDEGYRTSGSRRAAKPALKAGSTKKVGWAKSIYLWGKFSVAIMLAVGGAVVKGPAEMMKDCDEHTASLHHANISIDGGCRLSRTKEAKYKKKRRNSGHSKRSKRPSHGTCETLDIADDFLGEVLHPTQRARERSAVDMETGDSRESNGEFPSHQIQPVHILDSSGTPTLGRSWEAFNQHTIQTSYGSSGRLDNDTVVYTSEQLLYDRACAGRPLEHGSHMLRWMQNLSAADLVVMVDDDEVDDGDDGGGVATAAFFTEDTEKQEEGEHDDVGFDYLPHSLVA